MLGSQALETAIGLVMMFFIISLAASSIVEIISRAVGKRAKDLEKTIQLMLSGQQQTIETNPFKRSIAVLKAWFAGSASKQSSGPWDTFAGTSVFVMAKAAAGYSLFKNAAKRPSYLSAKAFADAVMEATADQNWSHVSESPLTKRLGALEDEVEHTALTVKAGLESWYDETMQRLEGAYKRWVTLVLFVIGLVLAVIANASTYHVADRLWHDPLTREAVVAAADDVITSEAGAGEETDPPVDSTKAIGDLGEVARVADQLTEVGLPVGWDETARTVWPSWQVWTGWGDHALDRIGYLLGWVATALMVMLGAPFWFDLLTRLVSLRGTGTKPDLAVDDKASATVATAKKQADLEGLTIVRL